MFAFFHSSNHISGSNEYVILSFIHFKLIRTAQVGLPGLFQLSWQRFVWM